MNKKVVPSTFYRKIINWWSNSAQKTHTNVQKAKAKIKEVPNTVKGEVKEGEQSGFFAQFKAARNDISKEINSAKDQLKREIDAEYKK